jgi:hypothetical protein
LGISYGLRIGRTAKLNRRFGGESRNPGKPDLNRRLREPPILVMLEIDFWGNFVLKTILELGIVFL